MPTSPRAAVELWRNFASSFTVAHNRQVLTWDEYTSLGGFVDEERIVQPTAFPVFAKSLLGWTLQLDLSPEVSASEGRPDFTPADSVTHPFVFEAKSTKYLHEFSTHEEQFRRYLTDGAPRVKSVVVTNLVGISIYRLDALGRVGPPEKIHLQGLLRGTVEAASTTGEASRLANFIDAFSKRTLTSTQKLEMVRAATPWSIQGGSTNSDWVLARLDSVVKKLTECALTQIRRGLLTDTTRTDLGERAAVLEEIRVLADRLGVNAADKSLDDFVAAPSSSDSGIAVQQYAAHAAYYAATRLMLVRTWEDLGLLRPMLYDGGFDEQMRRFDDAIHRVVEESFYAARDRYRSLFNQRNAYTWFTPDDATYADVVYELANTYLGTVESDILGNVYERMLERIDRKLLGAYYTPRDIISLIWDLIDMESMSDQTVKCWDREPRVFDIATGSGGFLVEAAARLRRKFLERKNLGADMAAQEWLTGASEGLIGIEFNRFSAYLAELNLLVQFGRVLASDPGLRLPQMGILSGDSLSLHNPDTLMDDWEQSVVPNTLIADSEERKNIARKVKSPVQADYLMDIACGNPPYIGEKLAAPIMRATRSKYPYWENFVGPHMDYLYWFLILGVSKLRQGGRFGFITTEYWLRAAGAGPLRAYLARNCHIEKILLFRDFRLFPDAPGQHSLIVIGSRVTPPDGEVAPDDKPRGHKPAVSIYRGPASPNAIERSKILSAMRAGASRSNVVTHVSSVVPNLLGAGSWAEVMFTRREIRQRNKLRLGDQVRIKISKGNETTVNGLSDKTVGMLPAQTILELGANSKSAGIQLLAPGEVSELGDLNEKERSHIHPVINTKDVYPYAVVLPDDASSVIYLEKPPEIAGKDAESVITAPFPEGMPNIESHLTKFRPILEGKTRSHGEKRPWWTLHRPRVRPPVSGDYADYCVLSRWGAGGRMVVGRAPGGASPASGLHVLQSLSDGVSVSYLCALYNSSLYQAIAESLPPGQLRKADLEEIGLPFRKANLADIERAAIELAVIVTRFVKVHGRHFPRLLESLRADVSLADDCSDAWELQSLSASLRTSLAEVTWCDLDVHSNSSRLGRLTFSDEFLAPTFTIYAKESERVAATVTFPSDSDARLLAAASAQLVAFSLRTGAKASGLRDLIVPIDPSLLADAFDAHRSALLEDVDRYRSLRRRVDDLFEDALLSSRE